MKSKFLLFVNLFLLMFALFGCRSEYDGEKKNPSYNEGETEEIIVLSSERKIIYNVTANLYIKEDFEEKVEDLKDSINEDEWTDYENISENYAQIVFRIKTTRLEAFIDSLSDYGKVRNLNKKASDVSLQYQDTSNQILALEAEKERLIELYDQATMSEIIQINTRISEIDKELRVLKGEIIRFDSLIDYSEVSVAIYNEEPAEEDDSYWEKIKEAFKKGIDALLEFLEVISIGLVTVLPFIVILGGIGLSIFFIRKFHLKKKKQKLEKTEEKPQ